jgi:hypothetical protein
VTDLERIVRELTVEINGQYPRPWMTSGDPSQAEVFIVGYNPAKVFSAARIGHNRHVDALFNRNGETCRGLYTELTAESPTRGNIEMLTEKLALAGVTSVLETNVICYSTSKKKDLDTSQHLGGKIRGLELFRAIVREITPKAMIIHGVAVRDEFNRAFRCEAPPPPDSPDIFREVDLPTGTRVFVIPSLALPGYQSWPRRNSFCNWADSYLDEIASRVAYLCAV